MSNPDYITEANQKLTESKILLKLLENELDLLFQEQVNNPNDFEIAGVMTHVVKELENIAEFINK